VVVVVARIEVTDEVVETTDVRVEVTVMVGEKVVTDMYEGLVSVTVIVG